ncbi:hypothetical protein D0T56_02030 [Dysgonomonas sp. 520]|nr:hypothetical protein [Dysgonomonas sp. 520]
MNDLLRERLISLLSDPTQVTNKEMQTAYGDFVEKLRTVSKSEQDYSEIFRMLNNTRIELVALQTFYQHEQGEKCG